LRSDTRADAAASISRGPVSDAAGRARLANGINQALQNVDQALGNVLATRAGVGARLRELDSVTQANQDRGDQYAQTLSTLEDLDYDPVACSSGAEAIELFRGQEFDLVISDVIMPEMTGPELIRHLKATETRDFAVLFVTGYVGESENDDLRSHELLRKPFTVGALAGAVSAALSRSSSEPPRSSAAGAKG